MALIPPGLWAADRLERLRADVPVTLLPSAAVKAVQHDVPEVKPSAGPDDRPRTLMELFSNWVGGSGAAQADGAAPVKVDPQPPAPAGTSDASLPGQERDAVVPIDPAPKVTSSPVPGLSADETGASLPLGKPPGSEPLGVLTTQLVSTSLVAASLWGKSPVADDHPGDELEELASASARSLNQPAMPASRQLVERAMPPLNANRVTTSEDAADHLTPIEPTAAPLVN